MDNKTKTALKIGLIGIFPGVSLSIIGPVILGGFAAYSVIKKENILEKKERIKAGAVAGLVSNLVSGASQIAFSLVLFLISQFLPGEGENRGVAIFISLLYIGVAVIQLFSGLLLGWLGGIYIGYQFDQIGKVSFYKQAILILGTLIVAVNLLFNINQIPTYLENLKTEISAQKGIQHGSLDVNNHSYTPDAKNFSCYFGNMGYGLDQFLYEDDLDLNTETGYLRVFEEASKQELNITYTPANDTGLYIENFRLELNNWIDEQKTNNPNIIILNGTIENSITDAVVQSVFLPKETIVAGDNIMPGTSGGYLTGIIFFMKGNYLYTFTLSEYQEIYINPPQKEFGSVKIEQERKANEIISKLLQYKDESCEFLE
ncbi:MAG TPA: hypothetical protein PLT08_17415 [Anaerolineales bacterium]|nr:hypothetical protein [Anaerolineales bacterium]